MARIEVQPAQENDVVSGNLRVGAELVGDAKLSKLDELSVRLIGGDGSVVTTGPNVTHEFTLQPGERLNFEARISSHSDGKTRFKVRVEGEDVE